MLLVSKKSASSNMKKNSTIMHNTFPKFSLMKHIIFPLVLTGLITLSSCSESIEPSQKHYTTYRTE
ncbi:MAG: hypothetical protein WAW59_06930 [Patescibacteria group bacterium]